MKVFLPSGHLESLRKCLGRLAVFQPDAQILILADKIGDQVRADFRLPFYMVKDNVQPFNWGKSVNLGLLWADGENLVVMDDNALLQTENGLAVLAQTAEEKGVGIIGPEIVGVCPPYQEKNVKENPVPWVIGACMFISGKCGHFFEEWPGYGLWEPDFCREARMNGFETVVDHRVIVKHEPSVLYPERQTNDPASMLNRKRYVQKWGDSNIWDIKNAPKDIARRAERTAGQEHPSI